jgi:hypothetical protein
MRARRTWPGNVCERSTKPFGHRQYNQGAQCSRLDAGCGVRSETVRFDCLLTENCMVLTFFFVFKNTVIIWRLAEAWDQRLVWCSVSD